MKEAETSRKSAGGAVLFVVDMPPGARPWVQQCVWYRVLGPGFALRAADHAAEFALLEEQERIRALIEAGAVRAVVLHRGSSGPYFDALRTWTRTAGVPLWYDVDDNIIEPAAIDDAAHLRHLTEATRTGIKAWVDTNRACMAACDGALLSCPALTEVARPAQPRAVTASNHLPGFYLAAGEAAPDKDAPVQLYYGPGSEEHLAHFELIAAPLARVLTRHRHVRLILGGGLPLPTALESVSANVIRLPRLPPAAYFRNLSSYSIALAPLRLDRFSACKSWIKPLEAAAQGCYWLGSPCSDYVRFAGESAAGRVVEDANWEEQLESTLAGIRPLRAEARGRAATIRDRYAATARCLDYLQQIIGNHARP